MQISDKIIVADGNCNQTKKKKDLFSVVEFIIFVLLVYIRMVR